MAIEKLSNEVIIDIKKQKCKLEKTRCSHIKLEGDVVNVTIENNNPDGIDTILSFPKREIRAVFEGLYSQ